MKAGIRQTGRRKRVSKNTDNLWKEAEGKATRRKKKAGRELGGKGEWERRGRQEGSQRRDEEENGREDGREGEMERKLEKERTRKMDENGEIKRRKKIDG